MAYMRSTRIIFILLWAIFSVAHAQHIQDRIDELSGYLVKLRQAANESELELYNEQFDNELKKVLAYPEAFEADFSVMKTLGSVMSPDKEFRLFTWNIEHADESQSYYACIVKPGKVRNKLIPLQQRVKLLTKGSETEVYEHDKWYGALYYKIIPVKGKRGDYYTLLGWDGHTSLSTRRVIETMTIRGSKVKFGVPAFQTPNGIIRRVVFEYMDDISMVMRYEKKKKEHLIVFDHLSPKAPQLEGMYEQYVPDGSYDAYAFREGMWVLLSDYNATNNKELIPKDFNDPREDRKPGEQ